MENPELLLLEFEEFNRANNSQAEEIPQNLENFIEHVSKTGTYIFPWSLVKKLFLSKLNNIINNLQSCMSLSTSELNTSSNSSYVPNQNTANDANSIQLIKDRIVERMKSFTNAPFTIQRICELLLKPNNHYNRVDKYLRGLEKCIMVVTTVDPSGNKIFMENGAINGVASNPSTPLITPTRPTTPPEGQTDATNESLIVTTPKNDEEEQATADVSSNQATPSKSDEPATGEYITESVELTEQTDSVEQSDDASSKEITVTETEKIEITEERVSMETSSEMVSEEVTANETESMVVTSTEMVTIDTQAEMNIDTKESDSENKLPGVEKSEESATNEPSDEDKNE